MSYKAAVLTVSDKGFRGQRADTSGPAVCALLERSGWDVVETAIVPDEQEQIEAALIRCADRLRVQLVVTTGGTGFSPRDVTPEATLKVIERRTPGIPEAMRAESMRITPKGCLSRSEAGIRGQTLIVNLPGSEKAALENLNAVLSPIHHGVEILLSSGSADCGASIAEAKVSPAVPSIEDWLREAKAAPEAEKTGMYLTHCGVVRKTPRGAVREGRENLPAVTAMEFSYDREAVEAAVAEARGKEGIYYVRVFLNEGKLQVGDVLMLVLVGGDIRPHVMEALDALIGKLKTSCVREQEIFD